MRVLGIIPARGGSKRVPSKNLRILAGKTLLQWTVESAGLFMTQLAVSSEDLQILQHAADLGAEPVARPPELAQDETLTDPVLVHALEEMESRYGRYDLVVTLQPTGPLRTPEMVEGCILELLASVGANSALTVHEAGHFTWRKTMWGQWVQTNGPERPRGQDLREGQRRYVENGLVFVTNAEAIRTVRARVVPPVVCYITPKHLSIDLDTPGDFWVAEKILEEKDVQKSESQILASVPTLPKG